MIQTPITVGDANAETAETIASLRAELAAHPVDGLTLQVTGGPAFGADITAAFDGADFTLLIVTIAIGQVRQVSTTVTDAARETPGSYRNPATGAMIRYTHPCRTIRPGGRAS